MAINDNFPDAGTTRADNITTDHLVVAVTDVETGLAVIFEVEQVIESIEAEFGKIKLTLGNIYAPDKIVLRLPKNSAVSYSR